MKVLSSLTPLVFLLTFFVIASTQAVSTDEVSRSDILDMSISSSEIIRIAVATPEVSREEQVVIADASLDEMEPLHGSAPLPVRLIQTGTGENIALLIFSLLLALSGVVIGRRK